MNGLSETTPEKILILGHDITGLMQVHTFAEVVCLLWRGNLPNPSECRVIDAILVSSILHTDSSPSIIAARTVAEAGSPLPAALAAGVLAMGTKHGGVVEKLSKLLQENVNPGDDPDERAKALILNAKMQKRRIPGFGHLIHPVDPRTVALFEIMRETGCYGIYSATAEAMEQELNRNASRQLPMNITGAIAAAISDLGFDWRIGTAFFTLSRMVGMTAHFRAVSM